MIARASERLGARRPVVLDQAMPMAKARRKEMKSPSMMGLIDRSRIIDLFDAVMAAIRQKPSTRLKPSMKAAAIQKPSSMISPISSVGHPAEGGEDSGTH